MSNDLWLLITIVRREDMDLLRFVHNTNRDTFLGQNYMYWNETEVSKIYRELFDFDSEVFILNVEELDGVKK